MAMDPRPEDVPCASCLGCLSCSHTIWSHLSRPAGCAPPLSLGGRHGIGDALERGEKKRPPLALRSLPDAAKHARRDV